MDCDIVGYHVRSFDFMCDEGLSRAAKDIPIEKLRLKSGDAVEFSYSGVQLERPTLASCTLLPSSSVSAAVLPSECRQRGLTYRAQLTGTIQLWIHGTHCASFETVIGYVPIMLCSSRCHLQNLSPDEMIKAGEERLERGGYFVCKGSEKVIRLLVATKRNFPLALVRNSSRAKGKMFTEFSVLMRSIRGDYAASVINLHYLNCASMVLIIQYRGKLLYVPLMYMLKALTDMSDVRIFEHISRLRPSDSFWSNCIKNMLISAMEEGVTDKQSALVALGSSFRVVLGDKIASWESNEEVTRYILRHCVCIHLDTDEEKFHCLSLMSQKLISLALGEILPESLDNPQFQEASVTGHVMLMILRERLEDVLGLIRRKLKMVEKRQGDAFVMNKKVFQQQLNHIGLSDITHGLEYLVATGNLNTRNGLGLMQVQGLAVNAERTNQLHFVSHFRAIHRGAFFKKRRAADVRKLRPEAWGFICPVHTPDGASCGLLNHVTASCDIVTNLSDSQPLISLLRKLDVINHQEMNITVRNNNNTTSTSPTHYPVVVDGNFVGYVVRNKAPLLERRLRSLKVDSRNSAVPYTAEICLIRYSTDVKQVLTQFPGVYVYTCPGRMMRPVKNLAANKTEYIGIFEQVYLSVIVDPEEAEPGVTMHQELHPSALFSFVGNLIPFPDHNPSLRNVYQCQMGKQAMGVPVHAWHNRADNRMYNLITPQTPILRLEAHNKYQMDEYPLGTNAIVAVISYTGYDMEDAVVINKASFERGFGHSVIVKVERLDLGKRSVLGGVHYDSVFCKHFASKVNSIGDNGLPITGRLYRQGDVYWSSVRKDGLSFKLGKYDHAEAAYCGIVRVVQTQEEGCVHALIQWRIPRNPIIGDKFASRHGQKGINSFLWPAESLPFSESGMVPDIIFNPHGFPSRMTIGMMIESMAGKSAALNGSFYDASPFVFNEKNTAINYFGSLLAEAGYNYYGNETMYSGIDGRELEVQIFFGMVYYQRLKHMIADKCHVRSTGAVNPITLQPVKGRKFGGIRFGEMERDAMIAHGASFCLQDRLLYSSDLDFAKACARCKSIVSVSVIGPTRNQAISEFYDVSTSKFKYFD